MNPGTTETEMVDGALDSGRQEGKNGAPGSDLADGGSLGKDTRWVMIRGSFRESSVDGSQTSVFRLTQVMSY